MLTLQYVPFHEIENLDSNKRIKKLLKNVKENKILLVEGRLKRDEETSLIKKTMEAIDDDFKGIELGVIYPSRDNLPFFAKLKKKFIDMLLGDRKGLTIIGPATIVKEIKQDPDKIELLTSGFDGAQVGLDKKSNK
ncbi:MAG: OapB/ArvB family protein [Nanobdellota archaeon]